MRTSLRTSLIATALVALPTLAHAHPGHDDGHEITWDFSHLVAHPMATLCWLTVFAGAVWMVWCLTKWCEQVGTPLDRRP